MAFDFSGGDEPAPARRERPDFLIDGWFGFFRRLTFVIMTLTLAIFALVAMTGLTTLF